MTDVSVSGIGMHGGSRKNSGDKPASAKTDAYLLMVKAKAQKEAYNAKKAELEVKQLQGELILVSDVVRVVDQVARACKEHLLGIPGRFGDVFAAESDGRKIERILDDEIRRALSHITEFRENGI